MKEGKDIIALHPEAVVLSGGTNDIAGTLNRYFVFFVKQGILLFCVLSYKCFVKIILYKEMIWFMILQFLKSGLKILNPVNGSNGFYIMLKKDICPEFSSNGADQLLYINSLHIAVLSQQSFKSPKVDDIIVR